MKRPIPNGILPHHKWLRDNGRLSGLRHAMETYPERFSHIFQSKLISFISHEEHIETAERLAKENSGFLPSYIWLRKNGYSPLSCMLHSNPELFEHIPRERQTTPAKNKVEIAENLAKEHGGVLPNVQWLLQHGYRKVYQCLNRHPELFQHIPQKRLLKGESDHIKEAECLANEHDGILPNKYWLQRNGHVDLATYMDNHPELFQHLKQKKLGGRSREENIRLAERLAKENGGVLPYGFELIRRGYSGLASSVRQNRESYKHIKQEKKSGTTLNEHIQIAKKLADANNGMIPSHSWMKKNGHKALSAAIFKYPKSFIGMVEKSTYQSDIRKNHIETAERLARENGGLLPTNTWLMKNNYRTLCGFRQRHKEDFKHIIQEKSITTPHPHRITPDLISESVQLAKRLAKENGGKLPSYSWLQENGYKLLVSRIYRFREYFKDIPGSRKTLDRISLEDHVKTAERLAKKNNNMLPNSKWLKKHRYWTLLSSMSQNKEAFSHIRKSPSLRKGTKDYVALAEKIAKENGGVLPMASSLQKEGYTNLVYFMRRHQKDFSHIEQKRRIRKTTEDHLKTARQLMSEHNGILPYAYWLRKNGYADLVACMEQHPERFKDIKQEYFVKKNRGSKVQPRYCFTESLRT